RCAGSIPFAPRRRAERAQPYARSATNWTHWHTRRSPVFPVASAHIAHYVASGWTNRLMTNAAQIDQIDHSLGIVLDPRLSAPFYRQIADQVAARILDGRLPAGYRLPPTRA